MKRSELDEILKIVNGRYMVVGVGGYKSELAKIIDNTVIEHHLKQSGIKIEEEECKQIPGNCINACVGPDCEGCDNWKPKKQEDYLTQARKMQKDKWFPCNLNSIIDCYEKAIKQIKEKKE